MANYDINYNDERFNQVKSQEQTQINNANNMYNEMLNNSDGYYKQMIDASKDYQKTQSEIQQANTDFAVEQINQQKEQAKQDYIKEQKGAYTDYKKASGQYGVNAENMAQNGMSNTGYSESSQVSMYNTYQNRYSNARDSYNRAVLNYDNSIKEAQLKNNSVLAEIAYNSLQQQLQLSLDGFQYKNSLLQQQLATQREINSEYYNRWRDVLSQINTENSLAEQIRQYNESMAEERRQYDTSLAEKQRQYDTSLAEERRQYENDLAYKKSETAREQANWEKQYELSKQQFEFNKQQALNNSTNNTNTTTTSIKKTNTTTTPITNANTSTSKTANNTSISQVNKGTVSNTNSNSGNTITLSNGKRAYDNPLTAYYSSGGGSPYTAQGVIEKGLVKQYLYKGKMYYYVP